MVNRVSRQSVIEPVKQPLCYIQNFARCSQYGEPCQPSVNQSFSQSQPHCQIQNFSRCSQYGQPCQPSVSQSVTQPFCQIQNFHGAHSMVNRVSRQSVNQPVKQPLCQIQNFARCSQYGETCQPTVNQSVSNHSTRYKNFHGAHSMVNRVSYQ